MGIPPSAALRAELTLCTPRQNAVTLDVWRNPSGKQLPPPQQPLYFDRISCRSRLSQDEQDAKGRR